MLPYLSHAGLAHIVKLIGYPGLFAVVFLESGVFFGFFLPGSSLLFTAGLLASRGLFNVWLLIPLLTLAAALGDSAGYWFGWRLEESFLKDFRWFRRDHLERAREFYDRHGVQAVLLARFVPIVRTFAPIVAGIVEMRYRLFLAYNIVGALLWAAGVTFAGYFLGLRVPFINTYITQIALVIIVITLIPVFFEVRKHRESRRKDRKE